MNIILLKIMTTNTLLKNIDLYTSNKYEIIIDKVFHF